MTNRETDIVIQTERIGDKLTEKQKIKAERERDRDRDRETEREMIKSINCLSFKIQCKLEGHKYRHLTNIYSLAGILFRTISRM
jgi:hypothetical protein